MQPHKKLFARKNFFLPLLALLSLLIMGIPTIASASPTKIMLTGDSITYGVGGTYGGYRGYLYNLLKNRGYGFDFVGSQTANSPTQVDPNHEGHPGWLAENIRDNIYDWLVTNPAELVLLHIGTNDMYQIADGLSESVWKGQVKTQVNEVSQVLDEIDDFSENTTVIMARIISRLDDNQKEYTTYFNLKLQEMVTNRSSDNLLVVDMENGAGLVYSTASGGSMYDNVHPNNTGYTKMANAWSSAISAYEAHVPCRLDSRFETATLQVSMEYYTDRSYALTSIPSQYVGMTAIKTPNKDQARIDESNYLKYTMPYDAKVYVAFDRRATALPSWMDGFTFTGEEIYTSLASQNYLKVYSKTYYEGDCVDLGANYAPGSSKEYRSNYFVFYGIAGSAPTCILKPSFKKTILASNIPYYTDRAYTITGGIPDWMLGRTLIQTSNDESINTAANNYLTFTNPANWWVYVLFDSRSVTIPSWLNGWEMRSDIKIKTSLSTQPYLKAYRKQFAAGQCVNLGGNYGPNSSTEYRSNYVVVYGQ